ncbi:ABC transporter [Rhizocola hellebori]|uniref:ABC transporter n=1 Tax=Rhizocola hellebori TaxID=1392758 RepID=A0A8J3QH45_9ACTN|nr:FtsX-like permease family protein [Rhizocola hellebori]GIH09605.1 ABC transporter [Rhizocola hellebori]
MLRATLKSLLARKLRLILSGLAVLLGVMFVSGSFVLTDSLGRSFDNMFANSLSGTDVIVTADPAINVSEMEGEPVPGMLTSADLAAVRETTGVAQAIGDVQADGARVIGANGKVVATFGPPRFGGNWTGEVGGRELREGVAPSAANEIVVNAALAKKAGIKVGDQVGVLTTQPKQTFKLVGIFGYEGRLDSRGPVTEVLFTEPVAQKLMLGKEGKFTSISVTTAGGSDPVAVRDALKTKLGKGYVVQTGSEAAAAIASGFKEALDVFNKILLGFAGVALFVGIFLILNTFSIIVAQRTKELALSRALGASRGQMIGSVLVEAVVIGLIASVLGLAAGYGVGALLSQLFASFSEVQLAGVGLPLAAVISAFAVGLIVTIIAAIMPAIRASRVPPVAALQEVATPDRPLTKLTVSGAIITAIGSGLIAFGIAENVWLMFAGVLTAFIGVALLSAFLARPAVSVLGRVFSWSVPGKLGRLNSGRNPRRTAITAAALMVGIALVTGVNTIVTSAEKSLRGSVAEEFHAELIVSGQGSPGLQPTFDGTLLPRMKQVPGVTAVSAEYGDQAMIDGKPGWVSVNTDFPAAVKMFSLSPVAGSLAQPGPDEVIVDDDSGHHLSDVISVQHANGLQKTYTVTGVYKQGEIYGGMVFGSGAIEGMRQQLPSMAFVDLSDNANEAAARKSLEALLVDSPEMLVQNADEYLDAQSAETAQFLLMIQVLLGLAILIAVLGVVNTLALSVLERTRELGLLRAIGLGRMATMRMITVEAMVITVFGAALGLAVGVGLGTAVVRGLADEGLKEVVLPWEQMGIYLVLGAVVGVIAAILPAIRAARTNVLAAISYE